MTISKVLERLCLARIFLHITNSPNFNPHQSAYLPGRGTETALIKISDDLYQIIDKGSPAVLASLDVSAAFDTIVHDRLLHRLTTDFGLSSLALAWLKSYLSGRTQAFFIGNSSSTVTTCLMGVPQGSVLGPLLFSAYVCPLARIPAECGIQHHSYTDDLFTYCTLPSIQGASSTGDIFQMVH